jgi:hypothetical protein
MSTLTGQSISGSYLSLIHLATNTQIANGVNTQLQDGAGNNIGVFVNTNGTLTATNFSGSLTGTASNATFALTARSASYAQQATSASSANYASIAGLVVSASFAISASFLSGTASYATNANFATLAGFANSATSASFATTASFARSASFATTASFALNVPVTASYAVSASFSNTAISSQTATSSSFATTASYSLNAQNIDNYLLTSSFLAYSSSQATLNRTFATTASNQFNGNQSITGSLRVSGQITQPVNVITYPVDPVSFLPTTYTASMDFALGSYFTITLPNGFAAPMHITSSNVRAGSSATLQVLQGLSGSCLLTFASNYTFPSGSAYQAFNSQSATDVITFISFDGVKLRSVGANNFIPQ